MCEIADIKIQKTGHEFKKVSMPAWKRTTMNGKFIELAREKVFQKKGERKEYFTHAPNKNINESGIKKGLR